MKPVKKIINPLMNTLPLEVRSEIKNAPKWTEIIDITDVVVETGRRRHGKSVLIYKLQEILSNEHDNMKKMAWGIPNQKHQYFPNDLVHFMEIEEIDENPYSILALDEIHQVYGARNSISAVNKYLSQAMTFSGQRNQILLMATLNNALIDINTFRICNPILIYKRVGKLQANSERSATKEFTKNAYQEWLKIPQGKRGTPERALESSLSYVVSDEHVGWMWNDKPSWWSEEASEMHAGVVKSFDTTKRAINRSINESIGEQSLINKKIIDAIYFAGSRCPSRVRYGIQHVRKIFPYRLAERRFPSP